MNDLTKQLFVRMYLNKTGIGEFVEWAIDCLEEGYDSPNLRMLAASEKGFFDSDIELRFRKALKELGWKYLSKKETLLFYSQDLAKKILTSELKPEKGCELLADIYFQINFPVELENWQYLNGGHSTEWYDRVRWLPFMQKYNHQNWLEAVYLEAKKLVETDFA